MDREMKMCRKGHSPVVYDGEHCPACSLETMSSALIKKVAECEELRDMVELLDAKCKRLTSEKSEVATELLFLREAQGVKS